MHGNDIKEKRLQRETDRLEKAYGVRHCARDTAHDRHVPSQCPKQRTFPPEI